MKVLEEKNRIKFFYNIFFATINCLNFGHHSGFTYKPESGFNDMDTEIRLTDFMVAVRFWETFSTAQTARHISPDQLN